MRAVFFPSEWSERVEVRDETFHHLVNVSRLRLGDTVLLMNGQGKMAPAKIIELTKRHASLEVGTTQYVIRSAILDVAIAIPKKDALEAMLKMSVELGVRRVWLLRGEYSPERLPEASRINALLESSLEQSNNPWLPEVMLLENWQQLPWADYQHVLAFDLAGSANLDWKPQTSDSILTLIGPEGGFSQVEKASWPNARMVKLDTSIMRAPTALACAWGWMLARRVS